MSRLTDTGLFVSPDGFCGERSRVVDHMSMLSSGASDSPEDRIRVAAANLEKGLYQCSDDWQGFWSQALEHEAKISVERAQNDKGQAIEHQPGKLYACHDEWRGPLDAALAHENELVANTAIVEAIDGSFRGTFKDALERSATQRQPAQAELRAQSASNPGGPIASTRPGQAQNISGPHSDRVLMRIYEADDGFRGTYEEVLDYEKKMGIAPGHEKPVHQGGAHDAVLLRIYEAPDGFRGTHDEVLAHEKALDMKNGIDSEGTSADDHVILSLYEAPDGFRGTYEEVDAHEKKLRHTISSNSELQLSVYEAPDGFLGTYEEVLAHEASLGHKFCDVTGRVVAINPGPSAESVLAADGVGLEQFVQPLRQLGVELAAELKGCHDKWLIANLNMTKVQIAKFREAVGPDPTSDESQSWFEASDGFVGSKVEVAAHEGKLQKQGDPGDRMIMHLYEVCEVYIQQNEF